MSVGIFKKLLFIALAVALITGCSIPGPEPNPTATTPSEDALATQVAAIFTATALVQPQVATATTEAVVPPPATIAPTIEPTATQAPTASPTVPPTPTTGPTATPFKDDPRTVLGSPTFTDKTFKENANWGKAWEDDFTKGEFDNNQLVLTSKGVDGWTVSWPKVKNLYLEMTATTGTCSGSDRYGVIIRVPEVTFDRGYMAGLTCDGQYSLRYYDPEAENYNYLINWTYTNYANKGSNQTNRIGLWAEDNTFKVYVNGHLVGEAQDDTLTEEGRFGPWIGHSATDNFTIYISEISYWDLP
jgi:hypothetical protein